jgi:hypothetical protein
MGVSALTSVGMIHTSAAANNDGDESDDDGDDYRLPACARLRMCIDAYIFVDMYVCTMSCARVERECCYRCVCVCV